MGMQRHTIWHHQGGGELSLLGASQGGAHHDNSAPWSCALPALPILTLAAAVFNSQGGLKFKKLKTP